MMLASELLTSDLLVSDLLSLIVDSFWTLGVAAAVVVEMLTFGGHH